MVNEFAIKKNTSTCCQYHVTGITLACLTVFNFPVKFQSHYLQNFKFAVF